ncbi:hypothetical protein ACIP5Y_28445 [Nocardia sp. NPDC088792]|uniref:hypothetical protein n=1 Tax=Nocardia sp. NPDC088792 TaxID=3364332 RepID=UPI00380E4170
MANSWQEVAVGSSGPARIGRSTAPMALIVMACALTAAPPAPVSAAPLDAGGTFLATNMRDAGARVALETGRFVLDGATGAVDVVDRAGRVTERLVPTILVDGQVRNMKFTIGNTGRELSVQVAGGLSAGSQIAATLSEKVGIAAQACFEKGLPAAILPGILAALAGGLMALPSGPAGIVTAAALAGLAGAWTGFVTACTMAAQESWENTTATQVHRLHQLTP